MSLGITGLEELKGEVCADAEPCRHLQSHLLDGLIWLVACHSSDPFVTLEEQGARSRVPWTSTVSVSVLGWLLGLHHCRSLLLASWALHMQTLLL